MNEILDFRELPRLLPKGTVIWRKPKVLCGIKYDGTPATIVPEEIEFERTFIQSYMARVLFDTTCSWEPVVWGSRNSNRGCVVFLDRAPTFENWTHLVLTGCSKKGNALFAKVGKPVSKAQYCRLFEGTYKATGTATTSIEEELRMAKGVAALASTGEDETRVVFVQTAANAHIAEFCHHGVWKEIRSES